MAVNLISSEEIGITQTGSDIQLGLTGKTGDLVVDSIRTKNMFDGIIEQGSFLPESGVPTSSTTRIRSASFTNVKAGNYTISLYNNNNFDVVVYVYDINGTFKSSESITSWQSLPYTINIQGERKIKMAIRKADDSTIVPSDVQNVQIEEGSTASAFSPFQNLTGNENYTTEEIRIGTWINGKPLYRKVINVGSKPTDTTINISNVVSNLDTLVRISGTAYNATFNQYYNIPNTHDTIASWFINAIIINKKDLQVRGGIGWNNVGGLTNIYVVLEYTKTTD